MLTVLLATRNHSRVLASVLESFCQLRSPCSGWKLVVVDNGSTDQTSQVIASFANRLPLQSLVEPKQGKNFALNAGLALVEGDLTVLTDDDVFPHEDWLIQLRNAAEAQPEFSIFGGSVIPHWEVPPPSWIQWAELGAAYAITDPTWQEGPIAANCIWGLNMAIRSDVFQSGVRFSTSMGPSGTNYPQGGDTELTRRLDRLSHKAWHVHGAVVEHFIRKEQLDRAWVMRRAIRHGRGEFRLGHADELTWRKLLLGTPRYLYRKLYNEAREMTKAWLMRRQKDLFRSYWRFNYIRGQIREARTLSQEKVQTHIPGLQSADDAEQLFEMNQSTEITPDNPSVQLTRLGNSGGTSSAQRSTVVIVGPPWPRSGAARVIKNQIDYYRARGFYTVFVVVPFHQAFMRSSSFWYEISQGIQELGAHKTFLAPLDENRYNAAKYIASLRNAFRGTALDWAFAMGNSVRVPKDLIQFLRSMSLTLLHVNYVQTLGFALHLRKKLASQGTRLPIILETHDVQSHLLRERRELNPWTHRPDPLERTTHSEISLLQKADVLVHLSVDDFRFFQTEIPGKPHVLTMPAIDETYIATVNATAPFKDSIDLLFVGQNHAPNLAAMKWFFEQVWPLLSENHYNLKIVGPVESLVRESLPQIFETFRSYFVGPVADLAPYYRSARCVIAPMVSGSGTSVKTIEALALGKPFVGTLKAFRGMPVERINAAGVQSYDTPRAFADAVVGILADGRRASIRSRAAYDSVCSVEANFASRDEVVRAATAANK